MKKSKQQKRDEALVRQAEHDALSLKQKLAKAILRRGESKREIERLHRGDQ